MGSCLSHVEPDSPDNPQFPINTEQAPHMDAIPISKWSQHEVSRFILSMDVMPKEQRRIITKFKKYKIDGDKLLKLNDKILKRKLKIDGVGLRLELMNAIKNLQNSQKSASQLTCHSLPSYYPFDYQYRVSYEYDHEELALDREHDHHAKDSRDQLLRTSSTNTNTTTVSYSSINECADTVADRKQFLLARSSTLRRNGNGYRLAIDIDDANHAELQQRHSWTVGTVVLIYCANYNTYFVGQIESVHDYAPLENTVTVVYDIGYGQIERKTINRFDLFGIKSDERFLKNRAKLSKTCLIEVFDEATQQWRHSYITDFASPFDRDSFVVVNVNNSDADDCQNLTYSRWSPQIRCSEAMLSLTINSEMHIFNYLTRNYNCAKIVDIFNNDDQLDIFKVIYKTDDHQFFYKYVHCFSANILLLNNDDERPLDYTLLEVAIHSNHFRYAQIKHDVVDERYSDLLLKGWLREHEASHACSLDFVNLLALLLRKGERDYIGPNYQLIIYLEQKFWCSNNARP